MKRYVSYVGVGKVQHHSCDITLQAAVQGAITTLHYVPAYNSKTFKLTFVENFKNGE